MTNAQKNSPMLKAAGLWAKSSVKGGQYLVHVIRSLDGLEALLRAEGVPPVGTLARGDAAVQERAR
jgi:hypothetical protein